MPLLLRAGETEAERDGNLDKLFSSVSGWGWEHSGFHSVLRSVIKKGLISTSDIFTD